MDGCKGGWVAIAIDKRGFVEGRKFGDFEDLMAAHASAKVIAVDMPIGLVDKPKREADQAARDALKGQASSVFNAPPRAALSAKTYERANAISRRVCKKGMSKQSFALFEKIRQVDVYQSDRRIFEVHPEVSFRLMNEGRRLLSKKSWGGLRARLALLVAEGIVLPTSLGDADLAGIDDVVDAAVAAWSARRIAAGTARSFPPKATQRSASGRVIAIFG